MRKSHNNLCVSLYKKRSKNKHIYGIVTELFDQFTPAAGINMLKKLTSQRFRDTRTV